MTDEENSGGTDTDGRPSLAERREVEEVYQPAEDSHLLAETVVEYVSEGDRLLDVGTGSGYVAHRAREAGARVVGSDLNPHACRQAAEAGMPVVRADMTSAFRRGVFDLVTFNPPYLPTDPEHEWDDWMEAALSGGEDGRAAVEPFLADVKRVLAPDGEAYLLISTLTDPDAVEACANENGLSVTRVASEPHPFEQLLVLALRRV
jgi:release factor glutamine methyltransferase